ncbi:class I SAM-dependent methyltransferase [Candidatus Woesearchaeota archaeon]|nr:class I SAM-dependent methyltransferase [Candidatus Woesearchaeota archaeon]
MDYYGELAPAYEKLHGVEQRRKMSVIVAEIGPRLQSGMKLLDVGCGTGISLEPWKCEKVGVEPSPELAAIARSKGLHVIDAIAENMPFKAGEFDVVISVTAAHHFSEKGFEEMKRVGKDLFVFSILRKGMDATLRNIKRHFKIEKEIYDEIDLIVVCQRL